MFIAHIPDEPQLRGYAAMHWTETNSLRHLIPYGTKDGRCTETWPPGLPLSHQKVVVILEDHNLWKPT